MHEYRYPSDDYILTLYYQGKKLQYRLKQYHIDRQATYWHLFTKSEVHELKLTTATRKLEHITIHGQVPFPNSFIEVLQKEVLQIVLGK
jgi:hypothetical protein